MFSSLKLAAADESRKHDSSALQQQRMRPQSD
jgi:hypothetical protein